MYERNSNSKGKFNIELGKTRGKLRLKLAVFEKNIR